MINSNMNINFTGFGIKDAVPSKVVKDFLNNENNTKLIEELDTRNVDVFMVSKGSELRFVSKKYGDLGEYGLVPQLVKEADKISSNISNFLKKVDRACFKAFTDKNKRKHERDEIAMQRGC